MSEERQRPPTWQFLLLLGWMLGMAALGLARGINPPEEVQLRRFPAASPAQLELRVSGQSMPSGRVCTVRPR